MRALILSAGYGTRLGELTKNTPKPTIVVGEKTVLEQIIDRLHIHGITDIICNVHYLPTVITEKIHSNALFFYEPVLLGHDRTIAALKNWLKNDNFFVINGDTISNIDFTEMNTLHEPRTILAAMDNWRCVGSWLYDKQYFTNRHIPVIPYRPSDLIWHDIGNPERLKKAKEYYETTSSVSDV